MSDLIDTTEMYLRTIYELHEEGIEPLRARIVERLHQSGPTVSQTVARLERDGLLHVGEDRLITLSETGWKRAQNVMRKHRMAERLLADVIGMEWADVHEEACRMEHVISDKLDARLAELLGDPEQSPYGCPIPSDTEVDDPSHFRDRVISVGAALSTSAKAFVLQRLSEFVQADEAALEAIDDIGLRPGVAFEALEVGDALELRGPDGRVRVDRGLAAGIWVSLG